MIIVKIFLILFALLLFVTLSSQFSDWRCRKTTFRREYVDCGGYVINAMVPGTTYRDRGNFTSNPELYAGIVYGININTIEIISSGDNRMSPIQLLYFLNIIERDTHGDGKPAQLLKEEHGICKKMEFQIEVPAENMKKRRWRKWTFDKSPIKYGITDDVREQIKDYLFSYERYWQPLYCHPINGIPDMRPRLIAEAANPKAKHVYNVEDDIARDLRRKLQKIVDDNVDAWRRPLLTRLNWLEQQDIYDLSLEEYNEFKYIHNLYDGYKTYRMEIDEKLRKMGEK